jgi:TetR/AcrR family transcriptional repressor of nem operon
MTEPAGKTPTTAKGEATGAFLLRTAAAVFAERGYRATTQNDLIAASGLTKGAFYFYFRSKRDLALAVIADQHGRWLVRVRDRVLTQPTPTAQFRALVPAMLDLVATEPQAWSITRLTRELALDDTIADEVRAPTLQWIVVVADLVRRGQAAGELRTDLDPHQLATVLVGAFDGLKDLTDILQLDQPAFAQHVRTLAALVELALVTT